MEASAMFPTKNMANIGLYGLPHDFHLSIVVVPTETPEGTTLQNLSIRILTANY